MSTEYFEHRERALLGERYDALYAAPSESAARGVTVSALRTTPEAFAAQADFPVEPSPFCRAGFVVRDAAFKPGRHPYHHAGVFYSQEPSASSAAPLLGVRPGMRVLDLCAGSGCLGLAIASQVKDARVVLGELSDGALRICRQNIRRNGLEDIVTAKQANVFDLLTDLADHKCHDYDFIILDPPAFTKSGHTVHNAIRGYKEINLKAMKLLPRGGYLATCSCSHFMRDDLFRRMLHDAAKDAGVRLRQIEGRQQSPDHPILWNVPETNYLKFYLFQVV